MTKALRLAHQHDSVQTTQRVIYLLDGVLDSSPAVAQELDRALKEVALLQPTVITVDAGGVEGIAPGGTEAWVDAVEKHLSAYLLVYTPSQLEMMLHYDELYTNKYPNHVFID